jgi:hypothetical protein
MKQALPLIVFLAAMIGAALLVQQQAGQLPERVASHFDAHGKADGWMPRAAEVRAILRLVLGTPLVVVALCYAIRFLPSRFLNVPHEAYWRAPENYPRACAIVFRGSLWIGALMALWAAALHALIVAANRQMPPALDNRGIALLTAVFVAGLGGCLFSLFRRFSRIP